MDRLHLEGPLPAWSDTALEGTLGEGETARPVMVFLGPEASGDSAEVDHEESAKWVGRTGEPLVPLLDVITHGDRSAWIHPRVEALGLVHLVDVLEGDRPPLRISAELVAAVADALVSLGSDGLHHRGPSPEDVGIDAKGGIHLLGFASPWPQSPTYRDPCAGTLQEQLVWRLGVLLAHLLGGRIPAVSTASAHKGMLRRVLIRAMSREGPLFTERYRSWLTGMLSWDPTQRPALSSVGPGLRTVGAELAGPGLADWCATQVPGRMRLAERAHDPVLEDTERSFEPWNTGEDSEEFSIHPAELSGSRTLPGLPLSRLPSDEVTAETTLRNTTIPGFGPRVEPGTMPVGVGPPAEAMRRRPSLPVGFLDREELETEPLPADPQRSIMVAAQVALIGLLGLVTGGMLLLAILVWIANP